MDDECIHGLEGELCASCFPKAAPVPALVVKAPRASRAKLSSLRDPRPTALSATTAARTAAKSPGRAAPKTAVVREPRTTAAARSTSARIAADNVGEQRIYHVTHVRNLASILELGALLADANDSWDSHPAIDISTADTRAARRAAVVAGDGSASVASYVPFFLSPNAALWQSVRANTADPRLELDPLGSDAGDFVILVSTVKTVLAGCADAIDADESSVTITDGDAAGTLTRFASTAAAADRMLRLLRANPDSDALQNAELLVADEFPFELVTLVGVTNDKVRDVVKPLFAGSSFRPKVVVYPPWFLALEETTE
ncbi:DUF4433 domain-containing protein [Cryobacterium frigoriphilum]|uniref:DUF4433 domain-containing protein n=1 Tax=Cryobacterium frigoriphilum TaxID=1259150 RepID=A0A4R9A5R0_9MICO|nr:DarT ssDNA thymidine ADP-ribosyltransferase family protein [Cryobacterium frigoriphilum]TFD52740.1 DUF4433 domain-containing protein [Cryobacterium frigoriphilum]